MEKLKRHICFWLVTKDIALVLRIRNTSPPFFSCAHAYTRGHKAQRASERFPMFDNKRTRRRIFMGKGVFFDKPQTDGPDYFCAGMYVCSAERTCILGNDVLI